MKSNFQTYAQNISIFGLIGIVIQSFLFLFYSNKFSISAIHDFNVLVGFEFILLPLNIFLLFVVGDKKLQISLLVWFSGFFLTFYFFLIDGSKIFYIIFFLLFDHFIHFSSINEKSIEKIQTGYMMRLVGYFLLLVFCLIIKEGFVFGQLTPQYLESSGYNSIKRNGGILFDEPHFTLWFALLYFSFILLFRTLKFNQKNPIPK